MDGENDPEIGIDKQKIVREIAQQAPTEDADSGQTAQEDESRSRGPRWWSYVRAHSDEISSLVILSVAFIWIIGGVLARHPVPVLIGAGLFLPGVLGLASTFRR